MIAPSVDGQAPCAIGIDGVIILLLLQGIGTGLVTEIAPAPFLGQIHNDATLLRDVLQGKFQLVLAVAFRVGHGKHLTYTSLHRSEPMRPAPSRMMVKSGSP